MRHMNAQSPQVGFTLIEIAIVLLVVTILLGYTVAMFPIQQELKQYRGVDDQLDEAIEHLIAFAQVNGRLPCPDTDGNVNGTGAGIIDGAEDTDDEFDNSDGTAGADGNIDGCKSYFGFLPNQTIGMMGKTDANGSLIDPWGRAIGYAVSGVDSDTDANPVTEPAADFVTPNGIRDEGNLFRVDPDLFICGDSTALGNHVGCGGGAGNATGNLVAGNVAAVVISLGKDFSDVVPAVTANASNIERENIDDFNNGTNDFVYISAPRSDAVATKFDDVVKWIPRHLLFSRMIAAEQLP